MCRFFAASVSFIECACALQHHVCCCMCGKGNPMFMCMMECLIQPCVGLQRSTASAVGCGHAAVRFASTNVAAVTLHFIVSFCSHFQVWCIRPQHLLLQLQCWLACTPLSLHHLHHNFVASAFSRPCTTTCITNCMSLCWSAG